MQLWWNQMRRFSSLILLAGGLLFLAGCTTTESDNASPRPWNGPKSWENGVPAGLYEGR
jgi:hypothetical protein